MMTKTDLRHNRWVILNELMLACLLYLGLMAMITIIVPKLVSDTIREWVITLCMQGSVLVSIPMVLSLGVGWSPWYLRTTGLKSLWGSLGAFCVVLGGMLLAHRYGQGTHPQTKQFIQQVTELGGTVAVLLLVCLPTFAEEIFFRGYIYKKLRSCWGVGIATILSSLLFALAHGRIRMIFVLFLMGILFAMAYEWSGRLATAGSVHAGINLAWVLSYITVAERHFTALWVIGLLIVLGITGVIASIYTKPIHLHDEDTT